MQTIEKTETMPQERAGLVARMRNRVSALLGAFAVALFVAPSAAGAVTATDPLNGGGDSIFTTLTNYLQTSLVGKVFALAVVSIAIGLVLRWVRKAVHA